VKKILVIEDDELVRLSTLDLLMAEGFAVIEASNGQAGIKLASEQSPDLIICDIMMPELDGYRVLEALQNSSATATIPFIFLTAKTEQSALRQGMELDADDYLTKPFNLDQLLAAIDTRLRKQTARTHPYLTALHEAVDQCVKVKPKFWFRPTFAAKRSNSRFGPVSCLKFRPPLEFLCAVA
jgi:DNA-binding response OmpR family regulator